MPNIPSASQLVGMLPRWLLLGLAVVWAAFPILFMVTSSFKVPGDIWSYPPKLWGFDATLENYEQIGTFSPTYFRDLWNSAAVTAIGVVVTIAISLAAAFAFSRIRVGWLRIPAFLTIIVRMFPPIVVVIPLYPFMSALGLLDTIVPLILVGAAFCVSFATLLLKAFIDDVPTDLEEAAMIDGCSRLQSFFFVTLPLIAPGIAAVVVFVAIDIWNEYSFALIFTSTQARTAPITIALAVSNPDGAQWGQLLAMSTIHLAPMLVLVLLVHKQLMRGMLAGGVKG